MMYNHQADNIEIKLKNEFTKKARAGHSKCYYDNITSMI